MPELLAEPRSPKYIQVAAYLRRQVEEGTLRPGDKLPTVARMRDQFGISLGTLDKVLSTLERDGLLDRIQGSGVYVAERKRPVLHGTVGLLGADTFNLTVPYWVQLLQSIQDVARHTDSELLLCPERFTSWHKIDGVLLVADAGTAAAPSLPPGMPAVGLMADIPGIPCVDADDFGGSRAATQHLLRLGHRRIAYLGVRGGHPVERRIEGYHAALREAGIEPDPAWMWNAFFTRGTIRDCGRLNMLEWLNRGWRSLGITAILVQNDVTAIGVQEALHEAGLEVPRDVSVVGFDGTEEGERGRPPLTSVAVPLASMGELAATRLVDAIRAQPDRRMEPTQTVLPLHLVERGSSGPAPQ